VLAYLFGRRPLTRVDLGKQFCDQNDEAGRAETALQRMVAHEAVLYRRRLPRQAESFDRDDVGAVGLSGQRQTRPGGAGFEENVARSAQSLAAADVRTGKSEPLPKEVGERHACRNVGPDWPAVDPHRDAHFVGAAHGTSARSRRNRRPTTPVTSRRR